jgi:hypothetical protein
MSNPVSVPIGQIVVDDRLQPRCDGLSHEHVTSLMETPEIWPPIVLARGNGGFFLIDGFHRHEAARQLGIAELMATIYDPPEGTDLYGIAFQLNAKHGRALKLRDRKAYALLLLRQYPDASDRELGRKCGLHHETIGSLRDAQGTPIRPRERKPGEPGSGLPHIRSAVRSPTKAYPERPTRRARSRGRRSSAFSPPSVSHCSSIGPPLCGGRAWLALQALASVRSSQRP